MDIKNYFFILLFYALALIVEFSAMLISIYKLNILDMIKNFWNSLQQNEAIILKGLWFYPFILCLHIILMAWFRSTNLNQKDYSILGIFLLGINMSIIFSIFVYITITPDKKFRISNLIMIFLGFITFVTIVPLDFRNHFLFGYTKSLSIAFFIDIPISIYLEKVLHSINWGKFNKAEWIAFLGTVVTAILGLIGTIISAVLKQN